jgi:succinoglycan biosynthesis protein ExoH
MTSAHLVRVSAVSDRIAFLRLLLILGIFVVHVPFADDTTPYTDAPTASDWMRVFLGDVVFRAGVPCLSAISGFLLFSGSRTKSYGTLLKSKLFTLGMPLLLWNLALFLLVYALQSHGVAEGYFPDLRAVTIPQIFDLLLAVSDKPINLPLYFLRDLFVCVLLSPLVSLVVKGKPWIILVAYITTVVLPIHVPFFLRTDILFAFSLGAVLAIHRLDVLALDQYKSIFAIAFITCAAGVAFLLLHPALKHSPETLIASRVLSSLGVLSFWTSSDWLVRTQIGKYLIKQSPSSFWLFCTHYPALVVIWIGWNKCCAHYPYLLFYLGCLTFIPIALVVIYLQATKSFSTIMKPLTGGR